MNQAVDFDKVRKRRQRIATLKRLLILAGVMLLVGVLLLANQIMVEEGITTTLSDFAESFGGSGFPVDLPGGVIHGVGNVGSNLTVLNDTNLYIYSPKGKILQNVQKMTEQGAAVPNSNRVLTFAVGDKDFAIHSLSRELHKGSLDYGILCGDMNERGDFALVSQIKQFAAKTIVYDKHFTEIYSWSSPEYVTNVSLSPKGDMMAVSCISSDGGLLESQLYTFRFSEDKEQAEIALRLEDNLVLDVKFAEDDRIDVLTDKQYLRLNGIGEIKQTYDFGGMQVLAMKKSERQTLLLFRTEDGKAYRLVLMDASLKEKSTLESKTQIKGMSLGKDTVYVLTSGGIGVYNSSFELKSKLNRRNISNIHLAGGRLYYLTPDEIHALTQAELTSVQAKSSSQSAKY